MKKRMLAILLAMCTVCSALSGVAVAAADDSATSVVQKLGADVLSAHEKGTDQYDIVYYAGRPYYVMDKDYTANENESGILMLSQYVYNYGTQWAYSRSQSAVNNDSTDIMINAYALSTFLNGGTYPSDIRNLATVLGDDYDFENRDMKYNSYYKRYTSESAVSGITAYFEKIEAKFTRVTLSPVDWESNVWYEYIDGQYVLASGSFDSNKTYYRDDAMYRLVKTPDWENSSYYYFKLETTAESKLEGLSNNLIGALYYVVPSITSMTTKNSNSRTIVVGTEATDTANSFIAQQKFKGAELGAILPVTKNSDKKYFATTWNTNFGGQESIRFKDVPINGESFFSLSAEEVNEYFADGKEASAFAFYSSNDTNTVAKWWLRSYKPYTTGTVGYFNSYNGSKTSTSYKNFISTTYPELKSVGVRPAFVLDPDKVLLVSDCSTNNTGKYWYEINKSYDSIDWRPLYDENTTEWKLTLIDDANLSIVFDTGNITVDAVNNTISVPYTGATSTHTGQHYISAFIPGVGYTRVAKPGTLNSNGKSGTATIKLPEGVEAENCQVQIFLERPNGVKITDYATTPVTITTETDNSEIETEPKTQSLKVLFIGNSLSEDARTFLPQAAEQYPYLDDAEIEFASLYQGGRSLGYFANCARVEQGDTDYDYSYYMNTNATTNSKPNLFTAEQIEKFNLENNGYNDATKNFCEYWVWDNESGKWDQEKDADNLGEKTIAYAMNEQEWDIVLVQGYACDFFGDNYDKTHTTGYRSDDSEEHLKDNLQYLTGYLRELQPGVKIGFYLPTVHLENVWKTTSVEVYADMMARKADIESWKLVDFTISGATAMENAKTTYLGTVTCDNTQDKVVAGLRRDTLHSSKYVGRELLAMNIVEYAVRYLHGEEGLVGFTPIETITSPAVVGTLPAEYANILHAAVDATIANPDQITNLIAFSTEDPAFTAYNAAKTAQEDGKSVDECIAAGKAALSKQQVEDLTVNTNIADGVTTVSFTYGYTTSDVITIG